MKDGSRLKTQDTGIMDMATWTKLARDGSTNAVSGLSQMVNQDMVVTALSLEEVSMRNAVSLIGRPEDIVVAIYLLFSGSASGHVVLAFKPETALGLVDMAMGLQSGTTRALGDMEKSALGEMGNVVGSFFLNAIVKNTGNRLMPSPPAVVVDMAGAITQSVMSNVLEKSNHVFVTRLTFATKDREIQGSFVVLPMLDSGTACS